MKNLWYNRVQGHCLYYEIVHEIQNKYRLLAEKIPEEQHV